MGQENVEYVMEPERDLRVTIEKTKKIRQNEKVKKYDKEDFGGRKMTKYHHLSAIYSQNSIEGVYA